MSEKILIVGPSWVGDMVMAQSLFKLLKEQRPGVELDVLAPGWSMPMLARMPEVKNALTLPIGHGEFKLKERFSIGKNLREKKYDQAIVLANSFKSALVPWFAHIPVRTGWSRELRFLIMNDVRRLDKKRYPLMVERYLALGLKPGEPLPSVYPIPELSVTAESQQAALTKHQLDRTKPILALSPGAEFGPAKRWPEEYYAEVANAKLNEGFAVWLLGSPKDAATTAKIMELTQNRCVDLAGKTSLGEAIDLLSLANIVVSNDSGLMHIAAALHRPLIAIYGPTSAAFTPPLQKTAKVLSLSLECQPCFERTCPLKHQKCMRDLLPNNVLQMMKQLCAS